MKLFEAFFVFSIALKLSTTQNVPGVCICVPIGSCNNSTVPNTGNEQTSQLVSSERFFLVH